MRGTKERAIAAAVLARQRKKKDTKKAKQTLAEKKAVHRAASKRWHDKWVKKGVPKDSQQVEVETPTAPGSSAVPEAFPQEIKEALVMDNMENLIPSTNDLRSTKAAFVKCYVELLNKKENESSALGSTEVHLQTNSEKYKAGVHAWMSSSLRSVLMSSKTRGFTGASAILS